MTTKTKKILIGIGSPLFGLCYSIIEKDLSFMTVIIYSLAPIILSLILMLIYTILVSLFEKNYKIEFVNTFFSFWLGTLILSIIGIFGSKM
jgi:hypothetical protein